MQVKEGAKKNGEDGGKHKQQHFLQVKGTQLQVLGYKVESGLHTLGLHQEHKNAVGKAIGEKEEKGFLVTQAYAIVHPRAVMVHLEYAASAHTTVVSAIWLGRIAFSAMSWLSISFALSLACVRRWGAG
jgi:hypothetical protein